MIQVKKAVRRQLKAKVALIGPSGSGKTYSALRLAKGFGGKILLANTEGDRGYIYASEFDYDIVDIDYPYTPEKYIEVMDFAESNGYETLIVDSGSHEWTCILDIKSNMSGNSYTNWSKVTPRHNSFVDKMLYSKVHIINCLRAKDQYVLEENDKGKQEPKKVGVGAQQRDNYEYEFMVTLMIDQATHVPAVMKDNTHLFENRFEVLTEEHGKQLRDWAESGAEPLATEIQRRRMANMLKEAGLKPEEMKEHIHSTYNVGSSNELNIKQADELINWLESLIKEKKEAANE